MPPKLRRTLCLLQETYYLNSLLRKVFPAEVSFKNQGIPLPSSLMITFQGSGYSIIDTMTGYIYLTVTDRLQSRSRSFVSLLRSSERVKLSECAEFNKGSRFTQRHSQDANKGKSTSLVKRAADNEHQQRSRALTILDLPPELVNHIYGELRFGSYKGELDMLALALSSPKFYALLKRNHPAPIRVYKLWDAEHPDFLTPWMGSQYRVIYQPTALYLRRDIYGDSFGFAQWEFQERRADYVDLCIHLGLRFPDCTVPPVHNRGNAWYYEACCLYNTGVEIGRDWERCWAGTRVMHKWREYWALAALEEWIEMIGF